MQKRGITSPRNSVLRQLHLRRALRLAHRSIAPPPDS